MLPMQINNSPIIISFDEVGFDISLLGKGSVYRETTISISYIEHVYVEWEIIYKTQGEGNIVLMLGVNSSNKSVSMEGESKIKVDFTIYKEGRALKLWFNLTSDGPEVFFSPESEIRLLTTKEASSYNTVLTAAYIVIYILPLTILAIRRFSKSERKEVVVVRDEE